MSKALKAIDKKIVCFDVTIPFKGNEDSVKLINNLDGIFKAKLTNIQLEVSPTGYKHYQIRGSTKKQYRATEIYKPLQLVCHGPNASPTSNANKGNMDYVTKEYTKCESEFNGCLFDLLDIHNKVLTKQMKLFISWQLKPWQIKLQAETSEFCLRSIDLVYDFQGCKGKSLFSEYMEYKGVAEEVPPYRLMDDIFQWVCTRPIKQIYIFDMPRGMKKDKLADFYSGIEVIKNGVAFDKRHSATKIRFDRPRIIVFTNELPLFNLMSADRWKKWKINTKNELEVLTEYEQNQIDTYG